MKKIYFIIGLLYVTHASAQTWNAYHQGIVDNTTLSNITTNLNEFVAFGEKNANKGMAKYNNLTDAKNWLKTNYQTYGYTDIVEDNFTENGRTVTNIVVTKTGTLYPNTYIIIDAHYDTLNGVGANDNGSGTSLLLEIARVMVNVPTEYSIKFIHFAGEEAGLLGSNYYADNTGAALNIRYVFNIDQVGGVAGMTNNTIVCEKDTGSPSSNNAASATLTNELATSIELYSSLNTEISYAYSSDYMPFEDNGEVITGLYEKNETTHAHSSTDIIANMDIPYVYEITQGALGALLHFAVADATLLNLDNNELNDTFLVYPNPIKEELVLDFNGNTPKNLQVKIVNVLGKEVMVLNDRWSPKETTIINLNSLASGIYLVQVIADGILITKKISKQ